MLSNCPIGTARMSIFAHGTPGELRGFKWIQRVVEAVARSPGYNNTSPRLVEKWVLIRHVVQMCLFGTLFRCAYSARCSDVLIRHVVQMCLFGTLFIMWGGNRSMLAIKCAFIETTTFMLQNRFYDTPFRSVLACQVSPHAYRRALVLDISTTVTKPPVGAKK